MSKRVKIAVIREATLNAKPTDTHYLAEGGLQISRRDARALKGTTLYYEVLVDLGEVKGFDFIPGRDVPVYLTDSEPVLALQPQSLSLVDVKETFVAQTGPITMQSITVDTSIIPQNTAPAAPTPQEIQQMVENAQPAAEAPAKRRPGRPKKVVVEVPVVPEVPELVNEPVVNTAISSEPVKGQDPDEFVEVLPEPDFQVTTEKQDDESTFLIEPTGAAPVPQVKPEFSFEMDEDEAPPPPPVRNAPQSVDFEVEEEETPAPARAEAPVAVPAAKPAIVTDTSSTDDFSDVAPGLFDE